jgi:hypothetical protein
MINLRRLVRKYFFYIELFLAFILRTVMLIDGKIFASQLRVQLLRRMFSIFREKLIILLGVLGFYFLLFRGMH